MSRVPLITAPTAKRSKNPFDLSYRQIMSAKAGMLLPFFVKDVIPGDHFNISTKGLIRTMPLNTAAFLRCKVYYHYYFVPYQTLWHQFDSFISRQDNRNSIVSKGSSFLPCFSWNSFEATIGSLRSKNKSEIPDYVKDTFGEWSDDNIYRLSELLGYGSGSNVSTSQMRPNLLRVLAYNKIYYDYYVNPYYESVKPELFNVDDLNCKSIDGADLLDSSNNGSSGVDYATGKLDMDNYARLVQMFTPKYRQWKKDMFNSLLPSPQFGDVSSFTVSDFKLNAIDPNAVGTEVLSISKVDGSDVVSSKSNPSTGIVWNGQNLSVSVLELRKAEAMQCWKENTIRAGYKADAQQLAHYGVKPRNFYDDHAKYLGGFDSVINIDEVLATANNDTTDLGQIGGKGISAVNGSTVNYDVTEFGVIMGLMSFVPESEYDGDVIETDVTRSQPSDFFTPEFENLGLQPVYMYNLRGHKRAYSSDGGEYSNMKVLGYGPRYIEYKTSVDKVFDDFRANKYLSAWSSPRVDLENVDLKLSPAVLHVNPKVLDSVFGMASTGRRDTDQFLCNLYVECKALRPMSVVGLPNY